jgi:hypothetical protein
MTIEELIKAVRDLQSRVEVLEAQEEARRLEKEIEYERRLEHGGGEFSADE